MVNVVSIHALREESDPVTLRLTKRSKNFNPHSPCGERLLSRLQLVWLGLFQSTLPLRGATPSRKRSTSTPSGFQSTLPLRGATMHDLAVGIDVGRISIHTPLAGSDIFAAVCFAVNLISIHTPLAGSDSVLSSVSRPTPKFQSTLPLRGAMQGRGRPLQEISISIHTPLAGSD